MWDVHDRMLRMPSEEFTPPGRLTQFTFRMQGFTRAPYTKTNARLIDSVSTCTCSLHVYSR